MKGVPFALEMNVFLATGALPDGGGLHDQEAPFADALSIVLGETMKRTKKGRSHDAR